MGSVTIKYSYDRGIREIKKAWSILREGKIGIGKIAHNLVIQSTKRKPVTLKQISQDAEINYSTLKTYHGYYVDIIKHLPPSEQKALTLGVLNRTSKQISRVLNKGYDNRSEKKGAVFKPALTSVKLSPSTIKKLVKTEQARTKQSLKLDRLLRTGYELSLYVRTHKLSTLEKKAVTKLLDQLNKDIN